MLEVKDSPWHRCCPPNLYFGGSENCGIRAPLPIKTPFSKACHEEEAKLEKAFEMGCTDCTVVPRN